MTKLKWEYINKEDEWTIYQADTDIGTYTMFSNEGKGTHEVEFTSTDRNLWQYVCGLFDIDEAKAGAEGHYQAKKEVS